jgi:hypothetical protein
VTRDRLKEIRAADEKVRVYCDRFGGLYVLVKDATVFGQRAIMHRRELLDAIERREEEEPGWSLIR